MKRIQSGIGPACLHETWTSPGPYLDLSSSGPTSYQVSGPTSYQFQEAPCERKDYLDPIWYRSQIYLVPCKQGLKAPWEICKLGIAKLRSMGFTNITDEDVQPHRAKYIKARKRLRKLDENLDETSKAIPSSSTTDAEAIEMIEVTSKDIDRTIKDVEQDTTFIEPDDRDKLLPFRELEGLDKQLRTIKGSLKVAIAKRVDLKARIEHEERKLSEVQDPTY